MPRHLITSALPYINGVKHLGNLVGSMLPADVYARFLRARGEEVLFICATDEHGTPAELAAAEAGLDVAEFCREQHRGAGGAGRGASGSPSTTSGAAPRRAEPRTDPALRPPPRRGGADSRSAPPGRCTRSADGRFLPDRYIVGTCPHCGYDRARGDQCENCTRLLDPTDLIEPRSAISGSRPTSRCARRKHLFLLQSKLVDELRDVDRVARRRLAAARHLDRAASGSTRGSQDRGITRDLDWGVPGDRPARLRGQGLLRLVRRARSNTSAPPASGPTPTGERRDWRELVVSTARRRRATRSSWARTTCPSTRSAFPARSSARGEPWKLVDYIKAFNWLTYYGGKFSTSQGRGVFMDQALEILPGRLLALVADGQRARRPTTPASPGSASSSRSTRTSPTPSATSSTAR